MEADLIAKYLKPLAAQTNSRTTKASGKASRVSKRGGGNSSNHWGDKWLLSNDGALLEPFDAASTDCLTQGVHFEAATDPEWLAQKLVRVNLSDFAAMGATPKAYLLVLACPPEGIEQWLKGFSEGLRKAQNQFNICLAGGDLSRSGTTFMALTLLGTHAKKPLEGTLGGTMGEPLTRSGAKIGDTVYVSGVIGKAVATKYKTTLPTPRLELGKSLVGIATSAIDVSDGLLIDLERICLESNCSIKLDISKIPITGPLHQAISGGEDYEIAFTAPTLSNLATENLPKNSKVPITAIGKVVAPQQSKLLDTGSNPLTLATKGFSHF